MVVPLPLGFASQTHIPSLITRKMLDQSQLRDMFETPYSAPQNCAGQSKQDKRRNCPVRRIQGDTTTTCNVVPCMGP